MEVMGISLCVGFVVNVHDPLNYDIDIMVSPETKDGIASIILGYADYRDYKFITRTPSDNPTTRKAYRCRLRGVVRRPDNSKLRAYRSFRPPSFMNSPTGRGLDRKAWTLITQHVDSSNGWVICSIIGVDRYRRVLVDIVSPDTHVLFRDLLLSDPYSAIFVAYHPIAPSVTLRDRIMSFLPPTETVTTSNETETIVIETT
jgi:hypothetical protein